MSDQIVSVSVDVTLLDKARFIPGKKPNKKGVIPQYVNLTMFLRKDGPDEYGNAYFVKQGCTKEEREAKLEMPILGNGKIVVAGGVQKRPAAPVRPASQQPAEDDGDDVPF
jgi:hypothetical protein